MEKSKQENNLNIFNEKANHQVNKVEFSINYKTDYGQVLCIVGNIPEVGKNFKPL